MNYSINLPGAVGKTLYPNIGKSRSYIVTMQCHNITGIE